MFDSCLTNQGSITQKIQHMSCKTHAYGGNQFFSNKLTPKYQTNLFLYMFLPHEPLTVEYPMSESVTCAFQSALC